MTEEEWREVMNNFDFSINDGPLELKDYEKMYTGLKEELAELYKKAGKEDEYVIDPMIKWDDKEIDLVEGVNNCPDIELIKPIIKKYFEKYKLDVSGWKITTWAGKRGTKQYKFTDDK